MSGTCYECAGKHPSVAVQAICPAAECLADDLMNEVAAVRVLRKNNQMLTRRLDRYAFDVRTERVYQTPRWRVGFCMLRMPRQLPGWNFRRIVVYAHCRLCAMVDIRLLEYDHSLVIS